MVNNLSIFFLDISNLVLYKSTHKNIGIKVIKKNKNVKIVLFFSCIFPLSNPKKRLIKKSTSCNVRINNIAELKKRNNPLVGFFFSYLSKKHLQIYFFYIGYD